MIKILPETIGGIDVSHWNAPYDWSKVASEGVQFAICKASQGESEVDPSFQVNVQRAKAAGLLVGAYHFFDPLQDSLVQAQSFTDQIKACNQPVLIALDAEGDWSELANDVIISKLTTWLDYVQTELNGPVFLYVSHLFITSYLLPDFPFEKYKLWLVNHYGDFGTNPKADMIQMPTQNVPGVWGQVDIDLFQGSLADLQALQAKAV
jgi:lysozyme